MKNLLLILNVLILNVLLAASQTCEKVSLCSCKNSQGVLDLTPLTGSSDEPKFKDVVEDTGTYMFSYDPCKPFNQGAGCQNVIGCETDNSTFYAIAAPNTALFVTDPVKGLMLSYKADGDIPRTLNVILKCDLAIESDLNVTGAMPVGSDNYEMTLTSKYCCFQADDTTTTAALTTTTAPLTTTTAPLTTTTAPLTTTTAPLTTTSAPLTTTTAAPPITTTTDAGTTSDGGDTTEPSDQPTSPETGLTSDASETTSAESGSTTESSGSPTASGATSETTNPSPSPTPSSQTSVHVTGVMSLVVSFIVYFAFN